MLGAYVMVHVIDATLQQREPNLSIVLDVTQTLLLSLSVFKRQRSVIVNEVSLSRHQNSSCDS